ncbi:uncharacterized protein PFLUO_LOCUS7064 [Penicillium psychrofluorescens]|uniref:uncharacterized protein n=1 Tax=Penicillium psychrofluorescens TaxID=3158075 RepID=UPI003CCE2A53
MASILTKLTPRATGQIAHVTISRPTKLNALNSALLAALPQTLSSLTTRHPDLLAVILTGAGPKAFVGGADLAEMAALDSPASARAFITRVHGACDAVRECPVPVIARVNGFALGAGLELAASCDLRVAREGAVFGMPEVRVGIPSVVEAALLPNLIGWGRTRQLLMLGENISASDALRWGLVEKVVSDGETELDEAVEEWVQALEKNGPLAVRRQKALMRRWEALSGVDESVQAGVDAFGEAFEVKAENGETETEPGRMMGEFFRRKEMMAKGKL